MQTLAESQPKHLPAVAFFFQVNTGLNRAHQELANHGRIDHGVDCGIVAHLVVKIWYVFVHQQAHVVAIPVQSPELLLQVGPLDWQNAASLGALLLLGPRESLGPDEGRVVGCALVSGGRDLGLGRLLSPPPGHLRRSPRRPRPTAELDLGGDPGWG